MSYFARLKQDAMQVMFPSRDLHAIPSMDGPLSPNALLDDAVTMGATLPDADDVASGPDGSLFVSAERSIYQFSGPGYEIAEPIQNFNGEVGGIAVHPDGRLLVCVAGEGLWAGFRGETGQFLRDVEGVPLGGLTSVAVGPDGAIFVTLGSQTFAPADYLKDLMHKNCSGGLIRVTSDLRSAQFLAKGLAYPGGLCFNQDGQQILFTQSWSHSLHEVSPDRGNVRCVIPNLPGYPGRIKASERGYLLCLFGMRTHLTELVLREDKFRNDMIQIIDPKYWIGPALRTTGSCYEPLQAGNVKKLGVMKPWAPPRSYGLVIEMDTQGELLRSMHSRVGGKWHGITAAIETEAGLAVVSRGAGQLLRARWEAEL